ncbi:MAG: hypothetical protein RL377_1527 [Bacteroidota bacterium]|jgi:hypothetical protein
MDKQTLLMIDSQCENALIDKNFHEEIETWIIDHQLLFEQVQKAINSTLFQEMINKEKDQLKFILLFSSAFCSYQSL